MLERLLYQFGRTVLGAYTTLVYRLDAVQLAPFPGGAKIIAVNHPTTTDPFVVLRVVPEYTRFLITGPLFKAPLLGRYLQRTGHIPVITGNGRVAYQTAKQHLEDGGNIGIFPEGRLNPLNGGDHKPHSGVGRLALSTGATVVPVGVYLQQERVRVFETQVGGTPQLGQWYPSGPYAITIGAPMTFAGDANDRALVHHVAEQIMQRIMVLSHLGALRVESGRKRAPARWADSSGVIAPWCATRSAAD